MRTSLALVFAATAVAGCHKPASDTGAPADTAAQAALWGLAPDGLMFGVIATPHGLDELQHGVLAARAFIKNAPELIAVSKQIDDGLTAMLHSANPTPADLGLTFDKGFAAFIAEDGGQLYVVPVADKAKFLAVVGGKAGADKDTIDDFTCNTVSGVYVCAKPATMLARIGKAKLVDLHDGKPRGDLELAGELPMPGKHLPISLVAQLTPGQVVLRGTVGGGSPEMLSHLGAPHASRTNKDGSVGFGVVDLAAVLQNAPDVEVAPGVNAAALVKSIAGPATLDVVAGDAPYDLRIPLGDPAIATAAIAQCATLPYLANLGAKLVDGVCHVSVPQLSTELDLWVEGKELRVGKHGAPATATKVPMTAFGKELADGTWSFALYGRGTVLASGQHAAIAPGQLPPEAAAALRGMAMWNEAGVGIKVDGDIVRFVFGVRTAWANPDAVVAKLTAITPEATVNGDGAAVAKAISESTPTAPFAGDFRAGYSGLMVPAAVGGMIAAIAIPTFMDYMKKSKQNGVQLMLNRLGKNAKIYYLTNATYPVGETPLTPEEPCCKGPNAKCATPATAWTGNAVWSALDFVVDEPSFYQFRYHSSPDGQSFSAYAIGDLDCDGVMITYTLRGTSEGGTAKVMLKSPPPDSD